MQICINCLSRKTRLSLKEYYYLLKRLEFCIQLMTSERYPEENIRIISDVLRQFKEDLILLNDNE